MYFMLFYDYVEDIVERRAAYREAHIALLKEYETRGELVLAGAFAEPVDGAAIIFKLEDASDIEKFVDNDPYVNNGLVTSWRIRAWNAVVGSAL